jgi:hypothetical protein
MGIVGLLETEEVTHEEAGNAMVILLFAWLVLLQVPPPTLDPARGYGGAVVPTATPYVIFVRDPQDFPITVTPSSYRGGPYGTGALPPQTAPTPTPVTPTPAPQHTRFTEGVVIALITVSMSAFTALLVAYLTRKSEHLHETHEERVAGDRFLLDKVAYLEGYNLRLLARVTELESEVSRLREAMRAMTKE